ncbi:hypothetical protein TNCV_683241 [Trichonephila clavipes]|nr:hypothetical protein TNCV_683241 [Trichonephila clavipes]
MHIAIERLFYEESREMFKVPGKSSLFRKIRNRATRGLLVTDLIILNYSQETRATPELAPTSPNFPTTPTGGRLSFHKFNEQRPLSGTWLERRTRQLRVRYLNY